MEVVRDNEKVKTVQLASVDSGECFWTLGEEDGDNWEGPTYMVIQGKKLNKTLYTDQIPCVKLKTGHYYAFDYKRMVIPCKIVAHVEGGKR